MSTDRCYALGLTAMARAHGTVVRLPFFVFSVELAAVRIEATRDSTRNGFLDYKIEDQEKNSSVTLKLLGGKVWNTSGSRYLGEVVVTLADKTQPRV